MWGHSPTLRQIWRQHVTGADYPEEFAHISFLPFVQLRSLVVGLDLSADQLLVDLACGAGGPGLWAAKESGARLVGIDLSPRAAQRASERAGPLGMSGRATFSQGTFEATGLEPASADAVMSVDALQYVPDKTAALVEVARILRPGGRFAFVALSLTRTVLPGCRSGRTPYRTTARFSNESASTSMSTAKSPTGQTKSERASVRSSPSKTLWKLNSVKQQQRPRSWRRQ